MLALSDLIFSGVRVFGLFTMDPALFAFVLTAVLFGGLNLLEYKKFW
ncbi:MAG: hypothetical protein JKX72_03730 [Robiginitomaculum sp.]|nr:hypothetical protein [Robiginitomaculum sp.]